MQEIIFFSERMPQRRPMRCMGMVWEASGWMMWLVLAMKRQLLTVLTMNGETTTVRTRRMSGSYVFQTAVNVKFKHFIILMLCRNVVKRCYRCVCFDFRDNCTSFHGRTTTNIFYCSARRNSALGTAFPTNMLYVISRYLKA